jgi:hypothetical protein
MSASHLVRASAALLLLAACSSDPAGSTGGTTTGGGGAGGAAPAEIRGARYCEILLAHASPPTVHVDVWNTFGLNDCPDAAWSAVDAAAVAKAEGATMAILNGPRYWTIDEFVVASLIDPTPKTLGGIAMRHAGSIDLPVSEASGTQAPYTQHTIQRHTTVRFLAGKRVYELVDPDGKVYDMQSYSVQKVKQAEGDLETLGARLKPPQGWVFRTRVLSEDLEVTAIGDHATVVMDELGNTYQQSQQ